VPDTEALAALSAVSSAQLGVFTRADAHEAGLSKEQLRRLVERGVAERVAPSVFRFVAATRSWNQQVLAAVLDGGPECLASHRTAAVLHGFDGFRPEVIEVLLPARIRHVRKNVLVHHTRSLTVADRAMVGAIPVTSRARTLIDLGAVAPAAAVEDAFDGAERERVVRRSEVESRYRTLRARGRNGIGAMTQVLDGRLAVERVPRSVLERRMLDLLRRAGLPVPEIRYRVRVLSGRVYELDFAYVDRDLGIELDGHGSHATRRERAADNVRANALGDVGWKLRRFTYEQVVHESASVAAGVRSALSAPRPTNRHQKYERGSPRRVTTSDVESRRGVGGAPVSRS
jgi:very-short-patch-repair endonuclease